MHTAILGMTRQGKTTFAVQLGQSYKKAAPRRPVIVFTVPADTSGAHDSRWNFADFVTTDRDKFLNVIRSPAAKGAMVFVDESNITIGKYDLEMESTGTSGSLNKLTMHYIAQRGQTFNRTVREQCSRLIMFRQGHKDSIDLAEEWAEPRLKAGPMLQKFEYFYVTTERGSFRKGKVKP